MSPPTESGPDEILGKDNGRRGDRIWAIVGGVVAGVVGFGGMTIVGTATSFEAQRLLEAIVPTVHFAASAYIAGGATILALMLTLITFSISHDQDFKISHYRRIRDIASLTTVVIAASVILLMFLSFPLGEADVQRGWYVWVYYALLFGSAVAGGIFISVILMLYYAVRELIHVGEDPDSSSLVVTRDDDTSRDSPPNG